MGVSEYFWPGKTVWRSTRTLFCNVGRGAAGLRTVEAHRQQIVSLLNRKQPIEVDLQEALGGVLGEDVVSGNPLPRFNNSAVDGFAVRGQDIAGASRCSPLVLSVSGISVAGATRRVELAPHTAWQVMTGAPVPGGADTIVPVEHTSGFVTDSASHPEVSIKSAPARGANVRRRGEDILEGILIFEAGTVLDARKIGVLSALGRNRITVWAPLRVLVISTGSELVRPGEALQNGEIYESNGAMMSAALRSAGALATQLQIVADDVQLFRRSLRPYLASVDLIVTTGGISAGTHEVAKQALAESGVQFVQVAMRPGKPQGLGRYENVPIVTFPGNPVSAYVSFEVLLRQALREAMGFRDGKRQVVSADLSHSYQMKPGLPQFRVGRYVEGTAILSGSDSSASMSSLADCDCLVEIPEGDGQLKPGSKVNVWLLND